MNYRLMILTVLIAFAACKSNHTFKTPTGNRVDDDDEMKFQFHFVEANRYKILGKYHEAFSEFEKAIKLKPDCSSCYYEIAGMQEATRQYKGALANAKKAVQLDGENKWILLFYADLTRETQQYSECEATFQKLIKLFPTSIDYYFDLSEVYTDQNKYQEAIDILDKAEEKTGIKENISMQKFALYDRLNKREQAINELKKLIAHDSKELKHKIKLADYYHSINKEDDAAILYQEVLNINPNNYNARLSLFDYYNQKKEIEKAFHELGLAFENPEMGIDTKVDILIKYYRSSKNDSVLNKEVFHLLEITKNRHPDDAKSYTICGDFYSRDGKWSEAKREYKKALEMESDKFLIWRQLLEVETELKEYQNVFDDAGKAIEYFPIQSELYWYRGISAMQLKKHEEAIEGFSGGVDLVSGNDALKSQFYSYLGDIYNEIKNYPKSDENYELSLKLDPKNVYVLNNYSYYLSLRKETLDKAADMSKKSNELSPDNASFEDTYGWILYEQKKYEDALEWLHKAEAHGGAENGTILEHLGDAYSRSGKTEKALEYWKKAKSAGDVSDKIDLKIQRKQVVE